MCRRCCLLSLFMIAGLLPLRAQFSGRISGSVADATGAAVPKAEVNLFFPGGKQPVLSATTTADGLYAFSAVRPAEYDMTVDAPGFGRATIRGISIDPARETAIPPVTLQLAALTQKVEVIAEPQSVETSSTEVSSVITMEQVRKLPVLGRDPLSLIQTQAGVVSNQNSNTVINGQRTSYSNMTLDGINIQDNYLRDNALEFSPNMLQLGQVRQLTLVTSNSNSAASGGSSQVAFVTPSGTNEMHGELVWYNRNSFFSANDWFNNQSGVARPHLNQNTIGGSLGGPIKKDKLFFYANYEAVRIRQQTPANQTILTSDARSGIFTYKNSAGAVQKANLLAIRGIAIDPTIQKLIQQVPGPENINNYTVGDSTASFLKNTGGYRFNQRNDETRDNVTTKIDYNLSPRNSIAGSYLWNRQNTDRPDFENDFAAIPKVTNPNHNNFISTSWRRSPSANLTNEVRVGANLTTGDFTTSQPLESYILTGTIFSDPVNEFLPQGRITNTWVISDNANYQRGRHNVQFGYHLQKVRVRAYDNAGSVATYNLFMGVGQPALSSRDLTGIRSADLATANSLLATLGAYIDSYTQTFNVTSRTSGYVPNSGTIRHLSLGEMDWYIQDNWKIVPRLTATIGVRYQLPQVANERDSLEIEPVIQGTASQTLLSNATLDFTGKSSGRAWYKTDKRDFAPNVGLAWDLFGNGKTALRAGYSINYVNDQAVAAPQSILEFNNGLVGISSNTGISARVSTGVPQISAPPYKVPLTAADNYAVDPTNAMGLVDPNLRTPYVQQWSFSLQHEIQHTILEARYVGNHAVGSYRAFDLNQVDIKSSGFLDDFIRARNNGFLALAQPNGVFNPAYNATIPGSQPLPVFAKLSSGGSLKNSTIRNLIQTGQPGDLATQYQETHANGSVVFFQNPNTLGADLLTNFSNSTYNALQLEATRRSRAGLNLQANYTFSKVLSDAAGDSKSRVEQFLDVTNPKLERARANFDLRHMIKGNATYDLPFFKGRRLLGGWSLGGITTWESGAPFSILSKRGTLNRSSGSRSDNNTAVSALTGGQLDAIVGFRMTPNGPYIVGPSAINPTDGTGVNGDGLPAFSGQAFFNPGPGTVGTLQRRMFSGPWVFDLDMSVQKAIKITERQSAELRMEGVNILNHPTFWPGDQNINSTTFGTMSATFASARVMQFGFYYRF